MVWHSAAERFAKAATLARSASIAGTASAKKKKAKTRTARGLIVRTYKLVKRRNPAWKEEAIYEQTALECRGKARPTEPDYPSASTVGRIIKEWKRTQS